MKTSLFNTTSRFYFLGRCSNHIFIFHIVIFHWQSSISWFNYICKPFTKFHSITTPLLISVQHSLNNCISTYIYEIQPLCLDNYGIITINQRQKKEISLNRGKRYLGENFSEESQYQTSLLTDSSTSVRKMPQSEKLVLTQFDLVYSRARNNNLVIVIQKYLKLT